MHTLSRFHMNASTKLGVQGEMCYDWVDWHMVGTLSNPVSGGSSVGIAMYPERILCTNRIKFSCANESGL